MKKKILVLLVLVSTAAILSADTWGRKDSDKRNNGCERMNDFLEDSTIVTVSGTLQLVNGELAKLVSGKVTYTIMAPIDQLIELEIKDGMKVTLEGVERITPMVWDGSEKIFIVTKITINGKTTEIDHNGRGFGMMGGGFMGRPMGNGFKK